MVRVPEDCEGSHMICPSIVETTSGNSLGALVPRVVAILRSQPALRKHETAICETTVVLTSLVLRSGFHFHPMTSFVPLGAFRAGVTVVEVIVSALTSGNSPRIGESRVKVGSSRRLSSQFPILRGCLQSTCQLCGCGQVKSLLWPIFLPWQVKGR